MNIMIDAYLDNNIGDDLMIKLLAENFSNHNFFIYSNSSVIRATYSDCSNIQIRKSEENKKDLKLIDVYLTIGGSLFQISNFRQYFGRVKKIIKLKRLKRRRVKIATLGSNLGPYTNFGKILTKSELSCNDLVTVRDQKSYEIIKKFKTVKNYHLADDIVYNIVQEPSETKDGLGISAYRSTKTDESNFETYQVFASIADDFVQRTGKKVKLFAFDSENENDLVAAHHIYQFSRSKEAIEIIPYLGNHNVFLAEFKKCEYMIAVRFHSAILSDVFKIPYIPVAYSNKMKNLMSDREFTGDVVNLEDLKKGFDTYNLVEKLVNKQGVFNAFLDSKGTSTIHFFEFENLLKKREIKMGVSK